MPGIAVILAPNPSPSHEDQLRRMVATLKQRGDDESGHRIVPEHGIYAGWVAHRGSYAARRCARMGAVPSSLMLAGECFGEDPTTALDAAPDSYHAALLRLNGQFAGIWIDQARGEACVFNDRFGAERLYAHEADGAVYVASEAKALLAVRPELRAFDDVGVAQFLAFGSTLDGVTLFRGLRLLPGATLLRHRRGTAPVRSQYFRPSDWECLEGLTEDEFESRFTETFSGLLPEYLQGEQPVGISLTGGLDTRMIVAALPKNQRPAVAYTYAAQGGDRLLDLTIARRVAQMRGIPHHALRVDHAFLGDYGRLLDRSVYVTDGCSGALGAHELFLSERARELAPVRLTGNFGSEVLRSMSTFKRNGPGDELLDRAVAGAVAEVVAEQSERRPHPVTHAAFREVPWHLYAAPAAGRSQLSIRTPFMDNRIVELAYRAPAPSRQSVMPCLRMIHACDPALSRIPTDRGVSWGGFGVAQRLRRLWASATFKLDYWHKDGLPDALSRFDGALSSLSHLGWLGQHKYLAYRVWFRESLAAHARQVIGDARTRSLPFWNREALDSIMPDHTSGRRNRLRDIHSVLTLEAVHRQLIDGSAFAQPSRTTSQGEQPCPTL